MDFPTGPIPRRIEDYPNFMRNLIKVLRDAFRSLLVESRGVVSVTGTQNVTTGLKRVDHVIATLSGDPVAGACVLAARPTITPGEVIINVMDNAGVASVVAIDVAWTAYGL